MSDKMKLIEGGKAHEPHVHAKPAGHHVPALPEKAPQLSKAELSMRVSIMERQIASLAKHGQLAHGSAQTAVKEAQHAMSFQGLLLKTLLRKGLIAEKDLEETAAELRKESALTAAEKQVRAIDKRPPVTVIVPPAAPVSPTLPTP